MIDRDERDELDDDDDIDWDDGSYSNYCRRCGENDPVEGALIEPGMPFNWFDCAHCSGDRDDDGDAESDGDEFDDDDDDDDDSFWSGAWDQFWRDTFVNPFRWWFK